MNEARRVRVLVAEYDDDMRTLLVRILGIEGYEVMECRDGAELLLNLGASRRSVAQPFDVVISDVRMPGGAGFQALEALWRTGEVPPVIVITAFGDDEAHARARQLGAHAVLSEPFEAEQLLGAIRRILAAR